MPFFWRRDRYRHDPLVCREFVELVSDYLDANLAASERVRFEAHLADCDGCAGYLDDMRRVIDSLNELPEPPPDPAIQDALLKAFRDLRRPA
jgi:anti-sigma factor RsiW